MSRSQNDQKHRTAKKEWRNERKAFFKEAGAKAKDAEDRLAAMEKNLDFEMESKERLREELGRSRMVMGDLHNEVRRLGDENAVLKSENVTLREKVAALSSKRAGEKTKGERVTLIEVD